jgi:hypothetical protein
VFFFFLVIDFADLDFQLVQGIAFQYFNLQDAVDNGGVPTKAVSLNATVDLQLFNPSGTFGYHIEPSIVNLMYLDLNLGMGQVWYHTLANWTIKLLHLLKMSELCNFLWEN